MYKYIYIYIRAGGRAGRWAGRHACVYVYPHNHNDVLRLDISCLLFS